MDKNAIKTYAVWARNELRDRVSKKLDQYEITASADANADSVRGELLTKDEKSQRAKAIEKVKEKGVDQVIEEVAYTWFNRFSALRFMEVNNYLPTRIRVFTDENNEFKPQILAEAIHMELDGLDMEKVYDLKEKNSNDELFKYLIITQCNALSKILPGMFQKIADYTELLFPDNLLREGSVIEQMIKKIPQEDFNAESGNGQVEILGWLYQYYISEKHEEVVDPLHGKVVKKEEVPAATQLFTTDWVVRYIIDNSVGRYWIERNPDSKLKDELQFFVKPKDGNLPVVNEKVAPQELTVFDPCVGSGHFLVYAFDVLVKIYVEYGYTEREAAKEIVENNLFGLDIDDRAVQLAYFAVMMKARQYDRRFFSRELQPCVYCIEESNGITSAPLHDMGIGFSQDDYGKAVKQIMRLIEEFQDAKEYGSILQITKQDWDLLRKFAVPRGVSEGQLELDIHGEQAAAARLHDIINVAEIMTKKYAVVATNPPYLNKYDPKLKEFINSYYRDYNGDLFSVFMYRNFGYCTPEGYSGFMTPFVWLSIKSYTKLREYILGSKSIVTLIQFEYSAYEEATVPICTFVLKNNLSNTNGLYFDLSEFVGGMEVQKNKFIEALSSDNITYYYEANQKDFKRIPTSPFTAYWVSETLFRDFENGEPLSEIAYPRQGMATTNNNKFLRMWYEPQINSIGFSLNDESETYGEYKWFPYNKGGDFRKWYGNNDYVVNFKNGGKEVCDYIDSHSAVNHTGRVINRDRYFKPNVTWSKISSGNIAFRYKPNGFIFDVAGTSVFGEDRVLKVLAGFLNSCVTKRILKALSPTLNFEVGHICAIPVLDDENEKVYQLVNENIRISKKDWDAFEVSWDYEADPIVMKSIEERQLDSNAAISIEYVCSAVSKDFEERFQKLKENEEELNRIFIDIYGLHGELTPEVEDKDVTVRRPDRERDIKNFISYAVGCMMGRYGLGNSGVEYAGGSWSASTNEYYSADKDGIIPICDDEYFEDDIVGLFVDFVKAVFGAETLEENLKYIADSLGGSGGPREVIRNYFLNGFYADHLKMYQNRPIYWLFDSGKKNGFKCLVYMHRYKPDTIARIRTDYVHEQQSRYRTAIAGLERQIADASTSERVRLNKRLSTLKDQAEETRKYEEKIHHLADQMISIDLDDGVKHNYDIFKDVLAKIK